MQPLQIMPEQTDVAPLQVDLCRELDFDRAELTQIVKGYWVVKVHGVKPHAHMKVELAPVEHLRQPDYWQIKIRGCVSEDIMTPKKTPYTVTLPLTAAKGIKGIEVVGTSNRQSIDIPKAKAE